MVGMRFEFRIGDIGDGLVLAARCATAWRVLAMWRSMRSGRVSTPCSSWKAVIGLMQAPKSRRPSRRARSRKAAIEDSSLKSMPWKAFVRFGQGRKFAGPVPVELAAVDQQAADGDAMAAEELGGGMERSGRRRGRRVSSARAW
jgi:hypothetical protein